MSSREGLALPEMPSYIVRVMQCLLLLVSSTHHRLTNSRRNQVRLALGPLHKRATTARTGVPDHRAWPHPLRRREVSRSASPHGLFLGSQQMAGGRRRWESLLIW